MIPCKGISSIMSEASSPLTSLAYPADSIEGMGSIEGMDSIESSLIPGKGRGSTSPFSILLTTCCALREAAFARCSICAPTFLSALFITPFLLRSACFCRRS
jgi:hypothetical protein